MVRVQRRRAAAGLILSMLAVWIVLPVDRAAAKAKIDFVSGRWTAFALFAPEEHRFLGCTAMAQNGEAPSLIWNYWTDGLELRIRNAGWNLTEGQRLPVTLSVDGAWHTKGTANVLRRTRGSGSQPIRIGIDDEDGLARNASRGGTLTVRAGVEQLSFSLRGGQEMLSGLWHCRQRGELLQLAADRKREKALDKFVAQQDAAAFTLWADGLAASAQTAAATVGLGDGIRLGVDRIFAGQVLPKEAAFAFRFAIGAIRQDYETAQLSHEKIADFRSAVGDNSLSRVLRALTDQLWQEAKIVAGDSQRILEAASGGDVNGLRKPYMALARRSYLSYAGDNVYVLIRNAARTMLETEYHANEAAHALNKANVRIVNAVLWTSDDALAAEIQAVIEESRGHIKNALRWIASGRAMLEEELAEAANDERRIEMLRLHGALLDEEEALADQLADGLTAVETAIGSGRPLGMRILGRILHGGERTAAAFVQRRLNLRKQRDRVASELGAR